MLPRHMEGEIVGQESPISSTSDAALNSMPSATGTDSISIELIGATSYNIRGMEDQDHFSLRGFVAGVRERDWLKCYPFPLGDIDDMTDGQRQLLPSLDVPKYKWWRCKCCVDELCVWKDERASNSGPGAECSAQMPWPIGSHQDLEADLLEERTINADNCNVGYTDHYACPNLEKGKKAELAKSSMIGSQMRFGDNASGVIPVFRSASPEVNAMVMHEGHQNDMTGSEIDGLSDPEPAIRNLKWMAKCAAESCKSVELTVTANQEHTESTKASPKVAEGTVAKVADNGLKGQPTEFPLPVSQNCNSLVYKRDNLFEKDYQDRNLDKLSSLHRKKARKVRLLADLLGENGDTKNENLRIQEIPENIIYDIPAVLSAFNGHQDKLDNQINLKMLGQNRKRKVPAEEVDVFSKKVANKELQNREEDADKDNAIRSTRSEDLWTGRILQNGLNRHWSNAVSDTRPVMGKKNNRKIREADAYLPSESPGGEEQENLRYVNGATQAGLTDNLYLKLALATFTSHEMPFLPLHDDSESASTSKRKGKMPQLGKIFASLSCKNGMVTDIPLRQRNEDVLGMGTIAVNREKGIDKTLQLSLNSCLAAPNYDRDLVALCNDKQLIPHFENRLRISFPKQVGTFKVDQVFRKEMETSVAGESSVCFPYGLTNIYEKGIVGEPRSQTASFRMPVMNENTYPSEVNDAVHIYRKQTIQIQPFTWSQTAANFLYAGKELTTASKNKRNVDALNSSVAVKKQFKEISDNAAEQGNIDDIPMEIVELMAKNQYERGLPDTERANCLLQTNNLRRNQQMVNCIPKLCNGELRLLGEETSQKRMWEERNGQNCFIVTGENDGVHTGKSVDYFSPFDANCHSISSRVQYHIPFAVGEVCQSKKKQPSDLLFLAENSSGLIGASNHKWKEGTLGYKFPHNSGQDSGGCDRHKTIFNQDGEAFPIWTAATSKHIPKGCDALTKVTSQSINMDMVSHGSSLLRDHNMKRHNNVQLFNLNTLNAGKPNTDYGIESSVMSRAGLPFSSKSSEIIELQKSSKGSGDFYSNDTIPAMHLLSLMQSGTSFDVNAVSVTSKGSCYPHDYNAKLNIGTSRDSNYTKRLPSNYFGDYCGTQKSNCSVFGSPPFGASIPSNQHDRSVLGYSNATDQIFPKSGKEKMKNFKSDMQIRTCKSQGSQKNAVIPVQRSQKNFPAVPDHVSIGCPRTGDENYVNLNLQYPDTSDVSRPLRKSLKLKICTVNRNPADFSAPDTGNAYMIKGEDLRFEKVSIYINGRLADQRGLKHDRNLKQTSQKERTKH